MIDSLIRIVRWTGPYRWRLFLGCLCSFFMTWATAAPVVIGAWLLAEVVEDANGGSPLDPSWVWLSFLAIAACVLLRFAFSYGKNRLQESIGYEVAPEDRMKIGNVLKRVPLGFFSEVSTGDILALATTELGVLELQGMKMVDAVVNGYVNLLAILCFLLFLSPASALAAVAGTVVSCLALASINRASQRLAPTAHEATERLAGGIIEYVRGLGTAKSYGKSGAAEKPILRSVERLKDARIAIEFGFTPRNVVHLIAFKLASVGVIACAIWAYAAGSLPLWSFFALLAFSFTIFSGVEKVNDSAHMLGDLGDILDRLEKVERAKRIDEDGQEAELSEHDIEFQDVTFSYDRGKGARKVLDHVNLRVPEGSTCAVVGPSGSGKTTIANLMMRFWDVDAGRVLVGGRDVRELTCDSLLRNFSAVFQSVYLFNDTIESNIRFGKPNATEEEVRHAAHRARVDEFAEALPEGYRTMVGEGGAALSGGQKQRISIARALLKDAPILILDDSVSAVDTRTEKIILDNLKKSRAGKTTLLIAHRISTVEGLDKIVFLEDGRVEAVGPHDQLYASCPEYRRMVDLQKLEDEVGGGNA